MSHDHINPFEWHQAVGYARQCCARIFRDGGTPADAMAAFGIAVAAEEPTSDWSKAVEKIAGALCSHQPARRAA